ncbi:MAG: hypothetical protein ABIO46_01035 [Chitinophagales bacterium]
METQSTNQMLASVHTLLKLTFGIVAIVAGLDKFTGILAEWESYLHPGLAAMLPFEPKIFMMIVGVIEIVAGIGVLFRPAIGGLVVSAWLTLIALTLLASGNFLDVAVRDLAMAVSAYSLARISKIV